MLDGAGFLIMHKDFLSPEISANDLEYVHITAKEREIAEDLLAKGHLVKKQCSNFEKINMENFYELKVPIQGVNTLTTGQQCRQYQLFNVSGSNAFLGENHHRHSTANKYKLILTKSQSAKHTIMFFVHWVPEVIVARDVECIFYWRREIIDRHLAIQP